MKKYLITLTLCTIAVSAAEVVNDWNALGKAWWKHVTYLASDKLKGRNVGSPGYDMAADYVADQFQKAGLKDELSAGGVRRDHVAFEQPGIGSRRSRHQSGDSRRSTYWLSLPTRLKNSKRRWYLRATD